MSNTDRRNLFQEGSLLATIEAIEKDRTAGKIQPSGPAPGIEYVHPVARVSANRWRDLAALRVYDTMDVDMFGDDQRNAPYGVLNPSSEYFGRNFDWDAEAKKIVELEPTPGLYREKKEE